MNIEFICGDEHISKHFPIVPAKNCLPKWYSELKAQDENGVPTITGCMITHNALLILIIKKNPILKFRCLGVLKHRRAIVACLFNRSFTLNQNL